MPTCSMIPETSWPNREGDRKGVVPSTALRSVWQTPQAATLIRTSPSPIDGISISSICRGFRASYSTAAFITTSYLCLATENPKVAETATPRPARREPWRTPGLKNWPPIPCFEAVISDNGLECQPVCRSTVRPELGFRQSWPLAPDGERKRLFN